MWLESARRIALALQAARLLRAWRTVCVEILKVASMAFIALEKLHLLHDGYRKAFKISGKPYLLLQEDGLARLLVNVCPHAQAPLTYATYRNGQLRCPKHGMEFDVRTGASPTCSSRLQFIPLVHDGNQIGINVP